MKQYLRQHGLQLGVAAVLMIALAAGVIDPATATIGGMAMAAGGIALDTAPADIKELHAATQKALEKINSDLKQLHETSNGKLSAQMKESADELIAKQRELDARLLEIEQKMVARDRSGPSAPKTLGNTFIESAEFQDWQKKGGVRTQSSSFVLPVKAAALVTSDLAESESTTVGVPPDYRPGIIQGRERQLRVRDLLMPGRTSSNAIWYVRETGFTNNAAPVTESAVKSQSSLDYELLQAPVVTIAHYFKTSKQILDDFPQLQSMIDGRGRYGLKLAEDLQLLKGSGTGQNINGIYTQATAYSAPSGLNITDETKVDRIRAMILQVELAEYPADGTVLHPTDWATIELLKDSQGRYIIGDPTSRRAPFLWGQPIVTTQSMTVDTALTGAFSMGAQIFDREEVNVVIATQNEDDFIRNLITIRIEERLALCVYRPEAFIKDTNLPAT